MLHTTPFTLTRVGIQRHPPLDRLAILSVLIGLDSAYMVRGAHRRARITGASDRMRKFLDARGWRENCSLEIGLSVKIAVSSVKVLIVLT